MQQSKRTRGDFISRASWDFNAEALRIPKPVPLQNEANTHVKIEDFSQKGFTRGPVSSPGMVSQMEQRYSAICEQLAMTQGENEFLKAELMMMENRFSDLAREKEAITLAHWQQVNLTEDLHAQIFVLNTENDRLKREVDLCVGLNFLPGNKVEEIVEKMESMNTLLADQIRANRELRANSTPSNPETLDIENFALEKGEALKEEVKSDLAVIKSALTEVSNSNYHLAEVQKDKKNEANSEVKQGKENSVLIM